MGSKGVPPLPNTPAGRQAGWYLEQMRLRGEGLSDEEIVEHVQLAPPWTPDDTRRRFVEDDGRTYELTRVVERGPFELGIVFDYGDDKPFRLTLEVDRHDPHRVIRTWWARNLPDDIVIRQATDDDAAALNDLEVRAPMTIGADTTVVYDRGADFLAFSRLMDENVTFVADREGELLGVACGAAHDVRIGGQQYRVMLLHHLRVPVEHRKLGVFSTLNGYVFGHYDRRTDGAYGYTALDNAEAMRISGPGTWDTGVFRVGVPTVGADQAPGARNARTATSADAEHVVDVLNRGHEGEEVFLPYTVDSFAQRLARDPSVYGWDRVRCNDGAVLGVWPAGLVVTTDGVPAVRAVALDHGFLPGHEADFLALLDDARAGLAEDGHDEVVFVLAEASPAYPLVAPLASRLEPFAFRMAVPEPPGTIERGVYVDTVYF
jgi:hypothetical protein